METTEVVALSARKQKSDSRSNASKKLTVRTGNACHRCHAQKIKCSGEKPCRNCSNARVPVECSYTFKDKPVTVLQSDLNHLRSEIETLKRRRSPEAEASEPSMTPALRRGSSTTVLQMPSPAASSIQPSTSTDCMANTTAPFTVPEPLVEEGLRLVSDDSLIQPMYVGEAACTTFCGRFQQYLNADETLPSPRRSRYYQNSKLLRISGTECQLPNRNYAQLLVRVAVRFVGADYHLISRRSFRERLDETYSLTKFDDPLWLCRLFTVFALGEVYSVKNVKTKGGLGVPGTGFFLKAVSMFQDLYEEPTIQYIETLLLLCFYSVTLNRRNTAYTYIGIALRCCLILGLHRRLPEDSAMTPYEREHRVRVWWSVYSLDRVCSTKVGHPVMLRDEDIDVQMPSIEGLTQEEADDFFDPAHLIAQIKLSRITGSVMSDIYRIPQVGKAKDIVAGIQRILTSLKAWHDTLPPLLRIDPDRSPTIYANRSVASLHLHFCQCVILTTRPILFHVFRSRFTSQPIAEQSRQPDPVTMALAEACIQTARSSNGILAQLWVDGNIAKYGFFDALSTFSSTLILMMSSALKRADSQLDDDGIETAWTVLKSMRDDGNVPASDYFDQLVHLKKDLDNASLKRNANEHTMSSIPDGLQMLLAASDSSTIQGHASAAAALPPGAQSTWAPYSGPVSNYDMMTTGLDDPSLQNFLSQQQPLWVPALQDPYEPLSSSVGLWTFDWEDFNIV